MQQFNPPPGWPPVPPGWSPPADWTPDPAWPPPPPGWPMYVDAPSGPVPRRRRGLLIGLVSAAVVVVLVVVLLVVVNVVNGHRGVTVVADGFRYELTITKTARVTSLNGSIAKPGYSFIQVVVQVKNLQSDRDAPLVDGVRYLGAPPGMAEYTTSTSMLGTSQSCDVQGVTGVVDDGRQPGWCYFGVAFDQSGSAQPGSIPQGDSVYQTLVSRDAFSEKLDANQVHAFAQTGTDSAGGSGTQVDLGAAG